MKQRKPLRRTPLRSRREGPTADRLEHARARAERIANQRPPVTLARGTYTGGTTGAAVAKRTYIRSKKLLAAVRTLPCMVTGKVGGTEPAHSNWPQHGKCARRKADDNRVAAMHRDLHRELDQGSKWTAEERQRIWWRAHIATVTALLARGLWPKGVPVPQLQDFWA